MSHQLERPADDWFLYLLRCANGDLYTGITTDVERRLQQHRNNQGAKRLRGRGPLELVFSCHVGNRSEAQKLEYRIKKLPKVDKEALIQGDLAPPGLATEKHRAELR